MKNLHERFSIKDSGLVIDLATGKTFSTNSTGLIIFRGMVEGSPRSDLVEMITDRFEVDSETASRDVDEFMVELKAFHLNED